MDQQEIRALLEQVAQGQRSVDEAVLAPVDGGIIAGAEAHQQIGVRCTGQARQYVL